MNTVEKIVDLIEKKEVQYKEFAKELGLTTNIVSEWKNGKTTSYKEHIVKIADYFGVTTDYLLRDGEQREQNFTLIKTEENNMNEKDYEKILNNKAKIKFDMIEKEAKHAIESYKKMVGFSSNSMLSDSDINLIGVAISGALKEYTEQIHSFVATKGDIEESKKDDEAILINSITDKILKNINEKLG